MPHRKPMTVEQARAAIDNLATDQRTARMNQLVLERLAERCYGPRWRDRVKPALPPPPSSATVD